MLSYLTESNYAPKHKKEEVVWFTAFTQPPFIPKCKVHQ